MKSNIFLVVVFLLSRTAVADSITKNQFQKKLIEKDFKMYQKSNGDVLAILSDISLYFNKNPSGYTLNPLKEDWSTYYSDRGSSDFVEKGNELLIACLQTQSSTYPLAIINKELEVQVLSSTVSPYASQGNCGVSYISENIYLISYIQKNLDSGVLFEYNSNSHLISRKSEFALSNVFFTDNSVFQCTYAKYIGKILCLALKSLDYTLYFVYFNPDFSSIVDKGNNPYAYSLNYERVYSCIFRKINEQTYIVVAFEVDNVFKVIFVSYPTKQYKDMTADTDDVKYDGLYLSFNFIILDSGNTFLISLKNKDYLSIYLFNTRTKSLLARVKSVNFESYLFQMIPSKIDSNKLIIINNVDSTSLDVIEYDLLQCRNVSSHSLQKVPIDLSLKQLHYMGDGNFNDVMVSFVETPIDKSKISLKGIREGEKTITEIQAGDGYFYTSVTYEFKEGNIYDFKFILKREYQNLVVPSSICMLRLTYSCYFSCEECSSYGNVEDHYCIQCKEGYKPLENSMNCYDEATKPSDIYFDSKNDLYRRCFPTCKSCNRSGSSKSNNCLSCINLYVPLSNYTKKQSDENNCVPYCNGNFMGWYFSDISGEFICTDEEVKCPSIKPYLVKETGECVSVCPDNLCLLYMDPIGLDNLIEALAKTPKALFEKNHTIEETKFLARFYDTEYLPLQTEINDTLVLLDECEAIIRKKNHIPENESMYLVVVEIDTKRYPTYQVDYQLYRKNGKLLSLSVCQDETITVYNKVREPGAVNVTLGQQYLKEGYNIFEIKHSLFTDFCVPFSLNGRDLILEDRINDVYQNIMLCDYGCEVESFDLEKLLAKCACHPKNQISEMIISREAIQKRKPHMGSNIKLIKCAKTLFTVGIGSNPGFIFTLLIFIFQGISIISTFVFWDEKRPLSSGTMVPQSSQSAEMINISLKKPGSPSPPHKKKKKSERRNESGQSSPENQEENKLSINKESQQFLYKSPNKDEFNFELHHDLDENFYGTDEMKTNPEGLGFNFSDFGYHYTVNIKVNDYWLSYMRILKSKHILYLTFCRKLEIQYRLLCISLLILNVYLIFCFTALFITDFSIHYLYLKKGTYYIEAAIPNIIITNWLISVFSLFMNWLVRNKINNSRTSLFRKIYLIGYTVILGVINLFFLYFLSAFFSVLKNTWKQWIITSVISTAIYLLIPFLLALIILEIRRNFILTKSKFLFIFNEFLTVL